MKSDSEKSETVTKPEAQGTLAATAGSELPPTCARCGEEMRYNVPRMGAAGGFIHASGSGFLCAPVTVHEALGNWMVRMNHRMIALCTKESDAKMIADELNAPNDRTEAQTR